jgi:DNA-binding Lrp family transcriptional regulator
MSSTLIDELDAKILVFLLRDGRRKFSDIANETNVSLDVIFQRYKKMEKEGIITGSTVLIDYRALGYAVNLNVSVSAPFESQELVIKKLREISGLYDVYLMGNKSDMMLTMHLEDTQRFETVKEYIRRLPCTRANFEIWTGIRLNMTNLSVLSNEESSTDTDIGMSKIYESNNDLTKLDDLDKAIIEQLFFNCRTTFGNLAKKTGTSISTIMRRYNRLKDNGVILPTIQISTSKVGYPSDGIFKLKATAQSNLNEIAITISNIPDVYLVVKTLGGHDFIVYVCLKNLEHLLQLQNELENMPDVEEIEATVLPTIPSGLPFPGMHKTTF